MAIDTAASELRVDVASQCCTELKVSYGSSQNPLHPDLTTEGNDRFVFIFGPIDTNVMCRRPFFILSDTQNRSAYVLAAQSLPTNPQAGFSLTVPFTELLGVDLSDVQSFRFDIGRYPGGSSFALREVFTVAEPATADVVAVLMLLMATVSCGRTAGWGRF